MRVFCLRINPFFSQPYRRIRLKIEFEFEFEFEYLVSMDCIFINRPCSRLLRGITDQVMNMQGAHRAQLTDHYITLCSKTENALGTTAWLTNSGSQNENAATTLFELSFVIEPATIPSIAQVTRPMQEIEKVISFAFVNKWEVSEFLFQTSRNGRGAEIRFRRDRSWGMAWIRATKYGLSANSLTNSPQPCSPQPQYVILASSAGSDYQVRCMIIHDSTHFTAQLFYLNIP